MKPIEDIIVDKIYELVNQVLSRIVKPDITLEQVTQLTEEKIEQIKSEYGIEGIILDVDETLRRDMKPLPEQSKKWIESIQKQLKVIVVSNGLDPKIEEYLKTQKIEYIGFANKPFKSSFTKACKKMNIAPEKVLVVGDNLLDDILGGKRSNMKTALVQEAVEEEEK